MTADVEEALRFLNNFAETTSKGACMFLPGVMRIQAMNRGYGRWVRLGFFGYSHTDALALAQQLLLPNPELVHPLDADVVFEGIPATRHDGSAGVSAKLRPNLPLPNLRAARRDPDDN